MEHIERSVLIEAPPARVFDFLTEPGNLPEIWPAMIEAKNAQIGADGSHAFDWTYKMAGLHFHGRAHTLEVERNRRRVVRNDSGIPSTFTWEFAERDHGTEMTLTVEYELPIPLIGRLAAPFLRRLNEREAETMLSNLKERVETIQEARELTAPSTTTASPPPPAP